MFKIILYLHIVFKKYTYDIKHKLFILQVA